MSSRREKPVEQSFKTFRRLVSVLIPLPPNETTLVPLLPTAPGANLTDELTKNYYGRSIRKVCQKTLLLASLVDVSKTHTSTTS